VLDTLEDLALPAAQQFSISSSGVKAAAGLLAVSRPASDDAGFDQMMQALIR
jgi:hypothetical protein